MKPSIILYKALPDDLLHRTEEHFTVTQVPNLSPQTVEQHAQAFASAEGLLGSSQTVDTALLEKMPKLRATSTISVGYDNFDVDALNARKVLLMHTPTVLTETVADTIMALVLSTARRVVEVAERVKVGEWTSSIGPDWFGIDVHHKTLGIVGMGRIGLCRRNAPTSASTCQFSTTPAATIRRRKNALTPAIVTLIRCCRNRTLSV